MKYSIKINLKKEKHLEAYPIRLRVTYLGARKDLRLGYSIEPDHWDEQACRVKGYSVNKFGQPAKLINRALEESISVIEKIFTEFDTLNQRYPTIEELTKEYYSRTGRIEEEKSLDIEDLINLFIKSESAKNNWAQATSRKFQSFRNHWKQYGKVKYINDLTESDLLGFVLYFEKKRQLNGSVAKQLSLMRWFLRWCNKHGYYSGNLHETFHPRLKGTDGNHKEIVYLDWHELMTLYTFNFASNEKYLERVRDVFCFCCFTGLRYSDVENLKKSDLRTNSIRVVTTKTSDGIFIELNKYSREILARYKTELATEDRVLPVISNQKMNRYLKIACERAGIDQPVRIVYFIGNRRIEEVVPKHKLISTHAGRRTFVVSALTLGIHESVIMEWTGHNDFDALKPYKKIVNDLKVQEMKKFDEAFERIAPTQKETQNS